MGRLIDADALIEVLKAEKKQDRSRAYGEHECDLIAGTIAMCIDTVKTIPTAYDIENVVAELEEWTFETDVTMPFDKTIMKNQKLIASGNAIDIVRKGGVE